MRISELFRSIQGESTYAGLPCTFVRTAGCSLRCSYCDTSYALDPKAGETMSLDEILRRVKELGSDLVEITGGEPLEQKETPELCRRLLDLGSTVLIETGGAFPIDPLPAAVIKILDVKTPSSKMSAKNRWANLPLLSPQDEIKFVIGDREDFDWSAAVCREHGLFHKHAILFSPSFNELPLIRLAEWILTDHLPVRLQLQLHKFIWPPHTRGV
ncbi:MAG: radical SAM protein [Candidatus Omnitrophota bacterium]|jgi:7-carboxy-7-deazaguanine synthase|nr:MAG: radical SAM protein [Candidatus Omnitrophota bacterium]